jgi:hypothetical protein
MGISAFGEGRRGASAEKGARGDAEMEEERRKGGKEERRG